ncbi:hypothetical protein Tco_1330086 [Tanacetum coccineum]
MRSIWRIGLDTVDAEMTDDGHDDVTQETTFDQVKDDAHVTFRAAHVTQRTEVPLQSSSVSSDVASQFLNLDNVPLANNEIIYMMNVDVRHEDPMSDFATPVIKITVIESLKDVVLARSSSQPQSTYEAVASLTKFELKKILIDKIEKSQSNLIADEHKELYKALVNSYNFDKDLFLVYGIAVSLKRGCEDHDKDEDPPAGSDQGMKRRWTTKDAKSSKGSKSKESKSTSSSKGTTRS